MEEGVFLESAVAEILEPKFLEARLHTDYDEFMQLEIELAETNAQPVFLVMDAEAKTIYAKLEGALGTDDFVEFLEHGLGKAEPDKSDQ